MTVICSQEVVHVLLGVVAGGRWGAGGGVEIVSAASPVWYAFSHSLCELCTWNELVFQYAPIQILVQECWNLTRMHMTQRELCTVSLGRWRTGLQYPWFLSRTPPASHSSWTAIWGDEITTLFHLPFALSASAASPSQKRLETAGGSLEEWQYPLVSSGRQGVSSLFLEAREERGHGDTRLIGMGGMCRWRREKGSSGHVQKGTPRSFEFLPISFNNWRRQGWSLQTPGLCFFKHAAAQRL